MNIIYDFFPLGAKQINNLFDKSDTYHTMIEDERFVHQSLLAKYWVKYMQISSKQKDPRCEQLGQIIRQKFSLFVITCFPLVLDETENQRQFL